MQHHTPEQLQKFIEEEITWSNKILAQRYFEGTDKPGKLLAGLIKKRRTNNITTRLVVNKKEVTKHKEIKKTFCEFFEDLYKADISNTTAIKNIWKVLRKLKFLKKL